jgi:hypothetical protein
MSRALAGKAVPVFSLGQRPMTAASFNFPRSVSGNPIRWLIVGGVLLIAAITIGATIMASNSRERALNNSVHRRPRTGA